MQKQFKDVEVGKTFTFQNINYQKIPDERISCCKVLNALNNDTKEKVMILPLEEVEVTS